MKPTGINKNGAKDLIGTAFDVAALLDYQEDAVVSREIIRKDTGTVTLFAFDKGQSLSEHTAPFDVLLQVVDGEAMVTLSKKKNAVKAGELIILPAGKPHAVFAKRRFTMLLTMVRA